MTDQGKNAATSADGAPGAPGAADRSYVPRKVESNDRRRFVLSVIIVGTWAIAAIVWTYISFVGPVYSEDGSSVVNDRPANIAAAVGGIGAVASAVIGFWFGAAGKASAEKAAAEAGERANQAEVRAADESVKAKEAEEVAKTAQRAVRGLEPLVDSAKSDLLDQVKMLYPEAFGSKGA